LVRRSLVAICVFAVGFQWATIFFGRHGDFPYHWEWGRRFVAGEFLYAGGFHIPYPPFWAMAHAPLTALPVRAAQVLVFPLAVAGLALVLWILDRLTRRLWPLNRPGLFWANAAALFLTSRFLLHDLAHSGGNSLLLFLVWAGIYLWATRREWAGGACLGLAIALKCTPALFLAYFAWKRQWRMAGAAALGALLLTLAPILRQGPSDYARHMSFWAGNVWKGISAVDPSIGVLGPEPANNISLRPALGRLLSRFSGAAPSPELLALESWVIRLAQGLLLVAAAWAFRGRAERDSERTLFELAAVGLLALLLSPITWRQHFVSILPAVYLLVRRAIARAAASVGASLLLAAYAVAAIVLNRTVTGAQLQSWMDSWSVLTFCLLGLLVATIAAARGSPRNAGRTISLSRRTLGALAGRLPAA
jgi:hypothetical protein